MQDWGLNRYAIAGAAGLLVLLACIAVAPSFIDESNVTLPPRMTPTSTTIPEGEVVDATRTIQPTATSPASTATATPSPVMTPSPAPDAPTSLPVRPAPTTTAVPVATPTRSGPLPLVLIQSGVVQDDAAGQQLWFALLENPNPDWRFENVKVRVLQVSGANQSELAVLELQSLHAGESAGLGELLSQPLDSDPARLQFQVEPGSVVEDSTRAPLVAQDAVWQPAAGGGRIGALIRNQSAVDLLDVSVLGIVRDADGEPVAARTELLAYVPGGGETGAVLMFPPAAGAAGAEIFLARTGSTRALPERPPPLVDTVAEAVVTNTASGETLWAAVFVSRHDAGTVAESQVLLTILDAADVVIGVQEADIMRIGPRARAAVVVPLAGVDAGARPARVIFHARFGEVIADRPLAVSFEDLLYLDDEGIPRIEAFAYSAVDRDLEDVELLGIAYGPGGSVAGAGTSLVENLPALGWSFAQVRIVLDDDAGDVESAEMFVMAYSDEASASPVD